jgi:hypothetical protein
MDPCHHPRIRAGAVLTRMKMDICTAGPITASATGVAADPSGPA